MRGAPAGHWKTPQACLRLCLAWIAFGWPVPDLAATPTTIRYQARLLDDRGTPLAGTFDVDFTIYDAETGGAPVWTESRGPVELVDGVVDLLLGQVDGLDSAVFTSSSLWLEVSLDRSILTPRHRVAGVPFALASDRLGTMRLTGPADPAMTGPGGPAPFIIRQSGSEPDAGFVRWGDGSGRKLHVGREREEPAGKRNTGDAGAILTIVDTGHVGIGTTSPAATLTVNGEVRVNDLSPVASNDTLCFNEHGRIGECAISGGSSESPFVIEDSTTTSNLVLGPVTVQGQSDSTSPDDVLRFDLQSDGVYDLSVHPNDNTLSDDEDSTFIRFPAYPGSGTCANPLASEWRIGTGHLDVSDAGLPSCDGTSTYRDNFYSVFSFNHKIGGSGPINPGLHGADMTIESDYWAGSKHFFEWNYNFNSATDANLTWGNYRPFGSDIDLGSDGLGPGLHTFIFRGQACHDNVTIPGYDFDNDGDDDSICFDETGQRDQGYALLTCDGRDNKCCSGDCGDLATTGGWSFLRTMPYDFSWANDQNGLLVVVDRAWRQSVDEGFERTAGRFALFNQWEAGPASHAGSLIGLLVDVAWDGSDDGSRNLGNVTGAYVEAGVQGDGNDATVNAMRGIEIKQNFGSHSQLDHTPGSNWRIVNSMNLWMRTPYGEGSGVTTTVHDAIRIDDQKFSNYVGGQLMDIASQSCSSSDDCNIKFRGDTYDTGHLEMDNTHLWAHADRLRYKENAHPTSGDDGERIYNPWSTDATWGVVAWGDGATVTTGTNVCRKRGLTCRDTHLVRTPGTAVACESPHGSRFVAYCGGNAD